MSTWFLLLFFKIIYCKHFKCGSKLSRQIETNVAWLFLMYKTKGSALRIEMCRHYILLHKTGNIKDFKISNAGDIAKYTV